MDLQTFRKQNAAYDDWSDEDLADGLHRKFYADMPRETFNQQVGYSPTPVQPRAVEQAPVKPGFFSQTEAALTPAMPSGKPQQMPMPGDLMRDPATGVIPDLGPESEVLPGASTAPITAAPPSVLQQIPTQVPMSDALKSTIKTWPDRIKRNVAAGLYSISDTALQGETTLPKGSAKREIVEKRKQNYLNYYEDAVKAVGEGTPIFNHQPYTKFVTEVATVTEDMFPAIGGGLAFGPLMGQQAMTLSLMGSQVFGPAYMEGINAGETPGQALFRGFYKAGVETLTEKIPVAKLFERGTPAIKRVLDMTVYEGAQEAASSVLNDLYDKGTITPDMTMREALANAGYEFLIGAGAGGVLGTAAAGAHKLIEPSKRERAGQLLWDLVDSGQINSKVAEQIAKDQMLPPQPGAIEPTGHMQKDKVGPPAAAKAKPAPAEKAPGPEVQQDVEDKAKILKALEAEQTAKVVKEPVEVVKEPTPDYTDVRLKRGEYRDRLKMLGDELVTGGGVVYVRDENDNIVSRTPSLNPQWFQKMQQDPDYKMSVKGMGRIIEKAITGERLGVKQQRILTGMLDEIQDQRRQQVDFAKQQHAKQQQKKQDVADFGEITPDAEFGMGQVEDTEALGDLLAKELDELPATNDQSWKMTKEQYEAPIKKKSTEAFYVTVGGKKIEVVQNPTPADISSMKKESRKEFGHPGNKNPALRFTEDADGNQYYWKAFEAIHDTIEPILSKRVGTDLNQNAASKPSHRSVVRRALYDGQAVPQKVLAEYPGIVSEVKGIKGNKVQDLLAKELDEPPDAVKSVLGIEQAADLKGVPDGITRHIKFISDTLVGKPFTSQGFSSLDVNTRTKVAAAVFGASKNDKVLNSIVRLFPIDVVDFLARQKLTPEMLLHDETMLFNLLSSVGNNNVTGSVKMAATSLVNTLTDFATKISSGNLNAPLGEGETDTASRADAGNLHIPIIAKLGQNAIGELDKSPGAKYTIPTGMLKAVSKAIGPIGKKLAPVVKHDSDFASQVAQVAPEELAQLVPQQQAVLNGVMRDLKTLGLPDMATGSVRAFMVPTQSSLGVHKSVQPKHDDGSIVGIKYLETIAGDTTGHTRMSLLQTTAHEIGHSVDTGHTNRGQNKVYASLSSPLFGNPVSSPGPIIQELLTVYNENLMELGRPLQYPMKYLDSIPDFQSLVKKTGGGTKARALINKESFAQLFSYYYTYGRTPAGAKGMAKHMPTSFQFMEVIHEILSTSKSVAERDASVREAFWTFAPGRVPRAAKRGQPGKASPEGGQAGPGAGLLQDQTDEAIQSSTDAGSGPVTEPGVDESAIIQPTGFVVADERAVWDKTARIMQDKFQRLYVTQGAIREQGGDVTVGKDAYAAEERMHGKVENDFKVLENEYIEPLADILADRDISLEDLDQYVYARHAPERNRHIATQRDDMPDGGSGMFTADAEAEVARLEAKHGDAIEIAAEAVWRMLDHKRSMMENMSLERGDTIDIWQNTYDYYVPLKGLAEDSINELHPRIGKGLSIKGPESKRAEGRRSRAQNITSQVIADTSETIMRARKNEVGQHFLYLVQANPNPGFWEIYSEDNPDREERQGKMQNVPMHMDPRYFGTKFNGKQYYVKMSDVRLAQAMQNLGVEQQGTYVMVLGSINRFLSSVNTSLNPEFVLSNFSRDIQTAVYNMMAETDLHDAKAGGEKLAWKMVKDTPIAGKSMWRALRDKVPRKGNQFDRYAYDFMKDGGKTGFFDSKDLAGMQKHVNNLIQMNRGGFVGVSKKMIKSTAGFIEDANGAVENGVRLSAYINAREAMEEKGIPSGQARKQAASLAKNLTVNFNRRGELSTALNAHWMFFNASVQGTAQFSRTMLTLKKTENGRRLNIAQKAAIGMVAFGYMLAFINRWISDDDKDGRTFYDKIPGHVKERNMVLMKGDLGDEPGDYWQIPLPYGYNIFHVLGTSVNDTAHGTVPITEGAINLTQALLGSFAPLGMSDSENPGYALFKTVLPTVLTPAAEIGLNENFFGSPVWREDRFNDRTPDSSLSFNTTQAHYKAIAKWMNETTGGSMERRGGVDVSPDALEHWFEFATGGAGKFIDRSINVAWKLKEGVPLKDREIPFWRKISAQYNEYRASSDYYDRRSLALTYQDTYSRLKKEGKGEAGQWRQDHAQWFTLVSDIKRRDKALRRLRKDRNVIRVDDGITEAVKYKKLERIQKGMNKEYSGFNLLWNRLIEKR